VLGLFTVPSSEFSSYEKQSGGRTCEGSAEMRSGPTLFFQMNLKISGQLSIAIRNVSATHERSIEN